MAITDIISREQHRSTEFECPHYAPLPGEKRCCHFLKNGACDRPDELMCVEWLKRNRPAGKNGLETGDRRLEGKRDADFRLEVQEKNRPETGDRRLEGKKRTPYIPDLQPTASSLQPISVLQPPAYGLQPDRLESFKALNVEVCLKSETFGEMWLVPRYTGRDRQELTPEHAATICRVLQAFPGSKVTAFEKTSTHNKENIQ